MGIARQYETANDDQTGSSSSSTITGASVSLTEADDLIDAWVFGNGEFSGASSTTAHPNLYSDGISGTIDERYMLGGGNGNFLPQFMMGGLVPVSSWPPVTQYLQGGSSKELGRNYVTAIQRLDSDEYGTGGDASRSSSSWADIATLTFTPPQDGDYLILASSKVAMNASNVTSKIRLDVDGTTYETHNHKSWASGLTAESRSHCFMVKVTLTGGTSTTIKIQGASDGTNTTHFYSNQILALRFDSFDGADYDENSTTRTITAVTPSYTTRHSWGFTRDADGYHLCLGHTLSNNFGSATTIQDEILIGGTTKNLKTYKGRATGSNDMAPHIHAEILNLTSDPTFLNQVNKSSSGIGSGAVTTLFTSFFCGRIPAKRRILAIGGYCGSQRKWQTAQGG